MLALTHVNPEVCEWFKIQCANFNLDGPAVLAADLERTGRNLTAHTVDMQMVANAIGNMAPELRLVWYETLFKQSWVAVWENNKPLIK